jgi:UrcA family protein
MKSIKLLLSVTAVTLSGLASATAPARLGDDVPSVVVKYDASSLATAMGVKSLHSRLRDAAQSVCVELEYRVRGLYDQRDQCVRNAVRRSVADVANQNLTNYHRYRSLPRVLAAN